MAKKKFMLRLDDGVFEAIEKWANDDFRSVNGQMEWILSQMLKQHKRKIKNLTSDPSTSSEEVEL
ncbi:MAG: Arc family DNA-binding protein [Saprospiraceae bacterium]|nr:Arc family DNA-binding protein [Saprospiraceae bacterium]MBK9687276.1 Arc family DNA-binding protein [Saprospiraceae bacterium]